MRKFTVHHPMQMVPAGLEGSGGLCTVPAPRWRSAFQAGQASPACRSAQPPAADPPSPPGSRTRQFPAALAGQPEDLQPFLASGFARGAPRGHHMLSCSFAHCFLSHLQPNKPLPSRSPSIKTASRPVTGPLPQPCHAYCQPSQPHLAVPVAPGIQPRVIPLIMQRPMPAATQSPPPMHRRPSLTFDSMIEGAIPAGSGLQAQYPLPGSSPSEAVSGLRELMPVWTSESNGTSTASTGGAIEDVLDRLQSPDDSFGAFTNQRQQQQWVDAVSTSSPGTASSQSPGQTRPHSLSHSAASFPCSQEGPRNEPPPASCTTPFHRCAVCGGRKSEPFQCKRPSHEAPTPFQASYPHPGTHAGPFPTPQAVPHAHPVRLPQPAIFPGVESHLTGSITFPKDAAGAPIHQNLPGVGPQQACQVWGEMQSRAMSEIERAPWAHAARDLHWSAAPHDNHFSSVEQRYHEAHPSAPVPSNGLPLDSTAYTPDLVQQSDVLDVPLPSGADADITGLTEIRTSGFDDPSAWLGPVMADSKDLLPSCMDVRLDRWACDVIDASTADPKPASHEPERPSNMSFRMWGAVGTPHMNPMPHFPDLQQPAFAPGEGPCQMDEQSLSYHHHGTSRLTSKPRLPQQDQCGRTITSGMPWKEPPPDLAAAGEPEMLLSGSTGTLERSHASPASSTSQVADFQAPAKRRAQTPPTIPLGSEAQESISEQHLASASQAEDHAETHSSSALEHSRERLPCQELLLAAQPSQGQGSSHSGSRKRRFGDMDDCKDHGQELRVAASAGYSMQVRSLTLQAEAPMAGS